eukprot:6390038-Pyramimonas_sp.AAC.1
MKAFEQVEHHWLLEAAVATGFPLWQLKLNVELYRAGRFCCLGQVVSTPWVVEQTMLPGDGWATCMLKLMLIRPLDAMYRMHRTFVPTVVVDDLLLHRIGTQSRVTRELVQASIDLQEALAAVDLRVHVDKSRVLCNEQCVRGEVARRLNAKMGTIATLHE